MSLFLNCSATAGILLTSTLANAGVIQFSLSPPPTGGAITCIAGAAGPDTGLLVFDQTTALSFSINATSEGLGVINFPNARLVMSMAVPPAVDQGGGFFRANVTGTFSIYDFTGNTRRDILTGTLTGGQFLKFGSSHVILLNSNSGLTYSAGPALTSVLGPGRTLAPSHDGTFALSNVRTPSGATEILGPGNVFQTFFANTAFTGSTNVIPSPGAIALLGAGGVLMARRRR